MLKTLVHRWKVRRNGWHPEKPCYVIYSPFGGYVYGSASDYEEVARDYYTASWWLKNPDAVIKKVRLTFVEE